MRVARLSISILFLILLASVTLAKEEAKVISITGTAEVKPPKVKEWIPVKVGMSIEEETLISTGFASRLELKLFDGSTLLVWPLTQMKLEKSRREEKTNRTRLSLKAGRLRAKVKRAVGINTDFKVATPTSTAQSS